MRPLVKICGLMRAEDARMCFRHGTDIVGCVVDYPRPVPWNLGVDAAREILFAVKEQSASGEQGEKPPAETCVVTGGERGAVLRIASTLAPNYIQLHCNETLEDTAYFVRELGKHNIKIIKTIFPNTPDPEKAAADFSAVGVYALLFDPRTPDNAGHGGNADIAAFHRLQRAAGCPVIIAGGITPENAAEIARQSGASILDLMTGVEKTSGVKDEERVAALFAALRDI